MYLIKDELEVLKKERDHLEGLVGEQSLKGSFILKSDAYEFSSIMMTVLSCLIGCALWAAIIGPMEIGADEYVHFASYIVFFVLYMFFFGTFGFKLFRGFVAKKIKMSLSKIDAEKRKTLLIEAFHTSDKLYLKYGPNSNHHISNCAIANILKSIESHDLKIHDRDYIVTISLFDNIKKRLRSVTANINIMEESIEDKDDAEKVNLLSACDDDINYDLLSEQDLSSLKDSMLFSYASDIAFRVILCSAFTIVAAILMFMKVFSSDYFVGMVFSSAILALPFYVVISTYSRMNSSSLRKIEPELFDDFYFALSRLINDASTLDRNLKASVRVQEQIKLVYDNNGKYLCSINFQEMIRIVESHQARVYIERQSKV